MIRSIRYKLLLSFIGIALLSLPFNVYLMYSFNNISKSFLFLTDYQLPSLQALLEMKNTVLRVNLFISNFDYTLDQIKGNESTPTQLGAAKDQLLAYLEEIGDWQKIYQQHLMPFEKSNLEIQHLTELKNEVILKALSLFSAKEEKLSQSKLVQKKTELEKAQKNLEEFINIQLNAETTNLDQSKDKTTKALNLLMVLAVIASLFVLVVACFIGFILSHWIAMPIISLRNFTYKINQDNLDMRFPILSKDEIGELAISINKMLLNLSQAKSKIIEASRLAGVAEVATNVIHNVGNILNSINTSVTVIMDTTNESKITVLSKLYEVINSNKNNLDAYLNNDKRGKLLLPYLEKLCQNLEQERLNIKEELNYLQENLDQIKQVVTMQLSSNVTLGIVEPLNIPDLIEQAITLQSSKIKQHNINVVRSYQSVHSFHSVKSKLVQVLVNLIKNAVEALVESNNPQKQLLIEIEPLEKNLRLIFEDNGIGILRKNLDNIFSFGFTTKVDGHGYGLHSCALLAIELEGRLSVESDGLNQGAKFILDIANLGENTSTA